MFLRAYGCAWLFLVCISGAIAQTQLPADRELSRERQERLLQEQQRRLEDLQSLPGRELSAPRLASVYFLLVASVYINSLFITT